MTSKTSVDVLIPVLDRPHRVQPLLASLAASIDSKTNVRPVFLCSLGDEAQIDACKSPAEFGDVSPLSWARTIVVPWPATRGDYARKMNLGLRQTEAEWVFFAADDLAFRPGWIKAALAVHRASNACVIGTNDLGNARVRRGQHSTHSLVHRDYLECGTVDEDGVVFHEGYWHNFCDDEFIGTARDRETFAFADRSLIEHLHPSWGKARPDATYKKGKARFELDRALYNQRRHLWNGPAR